MEQFVTGMFIGAAIIDVVFTFVIVAGDFRRNNRK